MQLKLSIIQGYIYYTRTCKFLSLYRLMSSGFDQFTTQKKSSNALVDLFKDTFGIGMKEMSTQISYLFGSPKEKSKYQIDQDLNDWEQNLKNMRKH